MSKQANSGKTGRQPSGLTKQQRLLAAYLKENAVSLAARVSDKQINALIKQQGSVQISIRDLRAKPLALVPSAAPSALPALVAKLIHYPACKYFVHRMATRSKTGGPRAEHRPEVKVEGEGLNVEQPLPDLPTPPPTERAEDGMVSTKDFAEAYGVASSETVRNHLKRGLLIGWTVGLRNKRLPLRQLDDEGRAIPQLPEVLDHFGSPISAWFWLTRPNRNTSGQLPLEVLRAGHIDEVLAAAAMYSEGAFT